MVRTALIPFCFSGKCRGSGLQGQRRRELSGESASAGRSELREAPHPPGMAVVGLGQLRGVADGIAFTLQ